MKPKPQTKKGKLVLELRRIIKELEYDKETMHIRADEALLQFINDPKVTKTFRQAAHWYA